MGINLPIGQSLAGRDLKKFKSHMAEVNNQFAAIANGTVKVAQRQVPKDDDIN